MTGILAVEMAALLLALVSIGAADSLYRRGRIGQRLHSLWVSLSVAAMCLPVLTWVAAIFVGSGAPARELVSGFEAALFVGLYRNLRILPAIRMPPPVERARPPASG
jgi:hypothetical protein